MPNKLEEHNDRVARLLESAATGHPSVDTYQSHQTDDPITWPAAPPALISLRETCALTSLSRTAINTRRAAGTFPRAVALGEKRIAFVRAEVEQWIRDRIAARVMEVE